MPKRDPAKLTKISLSLPFGIGKAEWESDPSERQAAWAIYIELSTRIAVEGLAVPEGGEAEAITSLYSIFGITREILKAAGPNIAKKRDSVGAIALVVLNRGLRPFLSKWHPEIGRWKMCSAEGVPSTPWSKSAEFREELQELQAELGDYTKALASVASVDTSRQ